MRRKKKNPSGLDAVGFVVGAAIPFALDLVVPVPMPMVAGAEAALFGVAASVAGADRPGLFRGAAFGAVGALVFGVVRQALRERAVLAALEARRTAPAAEGA